MTYNGNILSTPKFNAITKIKPGLTIVSQNIRSVNKQLDHVKIFLSATGRGVDIFACQEVWKVHGGVNYSIENFGKLVYAAREVGNGGGVGFWINQNITYDILNDLSIFDSGIYESLVLEVKSGIERVIVINVYRPPNGDLKKFLTHLKSQMINCLAKSNKIIFVGDYNVDISKENRKADEYLQVIESNGLMQLIKEPTRISPTTKTTIDHIIISPLPYYNFGRIRTDISDHLATYILIKPKANKRDLNKSELQYKDKISYTHKKMTQLRDTLRQVNWFVWLHDNKHRDIDAVVEAFTNKLIIIITVFRRV